MTKKSEAAARLEQVLGPIPKDFQDWGRMVNGNGSFSPSWRRNGIWAASVLAGSLGQDWMAKFTERESLPYLRFALAPKLLPNLAATVELALQIDLLKGVPGFSGVRRQIRSQPEDGVIGHARLQLEVAGLELRRSGAVILEYDRGPGKWKPDVVLSDQGRRVGVECRLLSPAVEVMEHMATPDAPEKVIDGWRRIGAMIFSKAGQPAGAGGWIRCELSEGMFVTSMANFESTVASLPLAQKAEALGRGTRQAFETVGELHGIVWSSPVMHDSTSQNERHDPGNGDIALRARLPGNRIHEVFIIPNQYATESECEMWAELYSGESSWLEWAVNAVGIEEHVDPL